MRRVEATLLIKARLRDVWRQVSDLKNQERLIEAFAGWGTTLRCSIVSGPHDPPADGSKIAITDAGGRPVMSFKVLTWDPPRKIELASEEKRWLAGHHVILTYSLTELDDELTSASAQLVVMFTNAFVEIMTLTIPMEFLYRSKLMKALAKLRSLSLAQANTRGD